MITACGTGGLTPLVGVVLEERVMDEILEQAEVVLRPFVTDGDGGVTFASPAVLMVAEKPR